MGKFRPTARTKQTSYLATDAVQETKDNHTLPDIVPCEETRNLPNIPTDDTDGADDSDSTTFPSKQACVLCISFMAIPILIASHSVGSQLNVAEDLSVSSQPPSDKTPPPPQELNGSHLSTSDAEGPFESEDDEDKFVYMGSADEDGEGQDWFGRRKIWGYLR